MSLLNCLQFLLQIVGMAVHFIAPNFLFTQTAVSVGHEPTWKTRHFCMNVAETQNFKQCRNKKCANISIILQAGSVVLTMFLQEKCLFVFEFDLHRVQPDWFALYK